MKVSFYLSRPKEKQTTIYCRIHYSGFDVKYYPKDLNIESEFWNKKEQRARQTAKFRNAYVLNKLLDNISEIIENTILEYNNKNNQPPVPQQLKALLDSKFKPANINNIKSFFDFFESFINKSHEGVRLNPKTGKPIAPGTIKNYQSCLKSLYSFSKSYKRNIDFDTIDYEFYEDYKEYLIKKLVLSTNTIGRNIQILKTVLNEASDLGINSNNAYKSNRFKKVSETTDNIYLDFNEIKLIENLDLSNHSEQLIYEEAGKELKVSYSTLDKVRDFFLIGLHTGLRFSDYKKLRISEIKDDIISFKAEKTQRELAIPINDVVYRILNKYGGNMPNDMSNQRVNKYIKLVCSLIPEFHQSKAKESTKGGFKLKANKPIYELITTHTARRSFATNEYHAGLPIKTIMAITGHTTEKSFYNYIKATAIDHAKILIKARNERKINQVG